MNSTRPKCQEPIVIFNLLKIKTSIDTLSMEKCKDTFDFNYIFLGHTFLLVDLRTLHL